MGTGWTLHAVSVGVNLRAIADACFSLVIDQMSQWKEASELSRFNGAPLGEWFEISAEFQTVIAAALQVQKESGGAFHPALGQWSDDWGFGAKSAPSPQDAAGLLKQSVKSIGDVIEYDAEHGRIKRTSPALLDLSGIAKGFAVDLVAQHLREAGVSHFMIEIGGELRGEGIEPNGQPWWVDIAMPPTSSLPPYRLALHGLSVATSGNYRRGLTIDGQYYSHSFDPRTGLPIRHGVTSVTIIHPSCMFADAWATALTILPRQEALAMAEAQHLPLCYVEGDREYISSKWQEMLE